MARPKRPQAVQIMEMAVVARVDTATPYMQQIVEYIRALEEHADRQDKAIGYLHSVLESGGAPTRDEQATVRFAAQVIIGGENMGTVQ
ncbi:hypothetical protein LN040_04025 [Desulfovibrio subterraneus]|uniref:Uncharacterized protein n=1 Tax=Desulfovibrio subterraneus TaxID=2718620 RepID=A0A7J0BLW5_9BACT|nr:hypothetical protein [Desulfovibrio subterraneus]WBF68282.1 hypothetical protein LN040_04025 [Desulfovibrio subterraneus]GFM34231.1 hypothetical protein DSM101010T_25960 [Desulfovibrio subterraneus]